MSLILVSPLIPKVITTIKGVITSAFGGILFNLFYYNYSSKYVIEPCRRYYSGLIIRLGV